MKAPVPATKSVPVRPADEAPRSLRRLIGRQALLGLGIFLILSAFLLPHYVYPRIAVLPVDPDITQVVVGRQMTVLAALPADKGGVQVLRGVTATSTTHLSQDPASAGARNPQNAVWRAATQVTVPGYGLVNARINVVSLDRRTAVPTNCCADRLITDLGDDWGVPLRHAGYYAWPFDVQPRAYDVWDVNFPGSRTVDYDGEERRSGVATYRFRGSVREREIGSQALPGNLFGLKAASVTARAMYSSDRTYWVEPNSGAVVDYHEVIDRYYVFGGRVLHAFTGVQDRVPPAGADRAVEGARQAAQYLPWIRGRLTLPLVVVGLGLVGLWLRGRMQEALLAGRGHVRRANTPSGAAFRAGRDRSSVTDETLALATTTVAGDPG